MDQAYESLVENYPELRYELDIVLHWYSWNHTRFDTDAFEFIRQVLVLVDTGRTVYDAVEDVCTQRGKHHPPQLWRLFVQITENGPLAQRYWLQYSRWLADQFKDITLYRRPEPGLKPAEHGALLLLAVELVIRKEMLPSVTRTWLGSIAKITAAHPKVKLWQTVVKTCLDVEFNAPLVNFVLASEAGGTSKGTGAEWVSTCSSEQLIEQGLRRWLSGVGIDYYVLLHPMG